MSGKDKKKREKREGGKKKEEEKKAGLGETTGEIIREDRWKFSRAIDALLRLAGTRSKRP